ncbi:MAG TPA: hypothetical protein DD671_14340, partial [Balneolaceae bacterium]|nr:hypothetical protein [Balneolaceae bacterium]
GNGYDSDNQRFIYAFNVGTNAPDAAAGAASIQVRNVTDNGGNETNPNDQQAQYVSASVDEAIDAIPPQIVGTPSMTFSTNTDENGDGIAAVGDEVTISAQVTGADSVVLDARYLGAGFVDMTNTSGDTWEVDVEVQEATDMLYASDNDLGNTTLTVTAFDTGGNRSSQNTSGLPVDNVSVKSPELFTEQQSDGRIQLTINNGPNTIIRGNNTVNFGTDMFGGSVAGTSDWV